MQLTIAQAYELVSSHGVFARECCDKCGRLLGAVRFTRQGEAGEWCSRECRGDGARVVTLALALSGTLSSNFATFPGFVWRNRLSQSFDNRFISARKETRFLICFPWPAVGAKQVEAFFGRQVRPLLALGESGLNQRHQSIQRFGITLQHRSAKVLH
jgi:hypothetical protein